MSYDGNVIIVMESAHLFESDHSGTFLQFWLPKVLPKRIKLVLTAKRGSRCMQFFKKEGFNFEEISNIEEFKYQIIDKIEGVDLEEVRNRAKFVDSR